MWFATRLGVIYKMPDMLQDHISKTHRMLDQIPHEAQLVVVNVSDVTLVIPKRIIKKAGVEDRCFWEAQ